MKHKPALSSAKPITSRRKVAGRAKKGPMALSKVDDKTECMGCPGSSFPSPAIAKKRVPSNVPMNKETANMTQSKQITHSTVRALPTPMIHLSSAHKSYTTISALIILTLPKTSFQWDADKHGILFVFQDSSFLSPWTNTCCESRSQGTKSLQNPPLKLVLSTLRWYLYLVPIRNFPCQHSNHLKFTLLAIAAPLNHGARTDNARRARKACDTCIWNLSNGHPLRCGDIIFLKHQLHVESV